nr:hypothetical protein [Oscillospiraceae bacterium]
MQFGAINLAGGIIVVLMLLPNIAYAIRCPGQENRCKSCLLNLLEQIGRYASMALMVLPVGVWEFGFPSIGDLLLYLFGNCVLLLSYWVFWMLYFRRKTGFRAMVLAVLPACIFLLCGITLQHWLLVLSGAVFAAGHICVTKENI